MTRVADIYRRTKKPKDILWNRFVARPLAAVLLAPLENSPITPNQVTLASLTVFGAAAALMVTLPGRTGLVLAVVAVQISYILDCTDGQLARLRGTSTPVGAHLDFLMDELKAFMLVAAVGIRLWRQEGDVRLLMEGAVAVATVASAISLTTFMRRPEYAAATGQRPSASAGDYGGGFEAAVISPAPPSPARRLIRAVESVGHFIIHYPSYLLLVAFANRLDLFLHAYFAINAAHAARSLLGIARSLGRFRRRESP